MSADHRRNLLLSALSARALETLAPSMQRVDVQFKEPLTVRGEPIEHVYFPVGGMMSLVVDLSGGQTIEAMSIGREGFLGLPLFLGHRIAPWRAFCQIPGPAYRLAASAFQAQVEEDGAELRGVLMRYTQFAMTMLAQTAACNRGHSLEERLSRWLLMTHDRVQADTFPLTQEFLSGMLGVRRPTVSLVGSALQRAGLIQYSRGRITVTNRAGLEATACECYQIGRQAQRSLGLAEELPELRMAGESRA
jgi:CRP-like cAMP-binding protein